jgi:hypothetical protein
LCIEDWWQEFRGLSQEQLLDSLDQDELELAGGLEVAHDPFE